MTYLFKLARRAARQRVLPLLALASALTACDTDRLTNSSEVPAPAATEPVAIPIPIFSAEFRGGIPFGMTGQPTSAFGPIFNGGHRNIAPSELLSELAAIKARGGRIILPLAGHEDNFKDRDGHFSLSMWKARIDRYRSVNFDSYIEDGTVLGHWLIDEPNDVHNWTNQPVPGTMLETMATYSKSIWPKMVTLVRVEPGYLDGWSGYRNLDAAWAQYVTRKGDPGDYIRAQVAIAQKHGFKLITGLNVLKGNTNQTPMPASMVLSAGSEIMANDYSCAFLNWTYDEDYLSRADIKNVMAQLSQKAEARTPRSCLRGGSTLPGVKPPAGGFTLSAVKVLRNGDQVVELTWKGAAGTMVDVYRNNDLRTTTRNDGFARSYPQRPGSYAFKICEAGKTRCSNSVTITIR